jgi:hypothetical protein
MLGAIGFGGFTLCGLILARKRIMDCLQRNERKAKKRPSMELKLKEQKGGCLDVRQQVGSSDKEIVISG